MKKREIPKKNYYILTAIILTSLALTFYWASWYTTAKEYRMNNSIIPTVIGEITIEEMDNYILENPEIMLYIASSKDDKIKDFEDDFKELIIKENMRNNIIYIDTSKIQNHEFYHSFVTKYYSETLKEKKEMIDIIPNIIVIEEGKVVDIMYYTKKEISKKDTKKFLQKHGVIEK